MENLFATHALKIIWYCDLRCIHIVLFYICKFTLLHQSQTFPEPEKDAWRSLSWNNERVRRSWCHGEGSLKANACTIFWSWSLMEVEPAEFRFRFRFRNWQNPSFGTVSITACSEADDYNVWAGYGYGSNRNMGFGPVIAERAEINFGRPLHRGMSVT